MMRRRKVSGGPSSNGFDSCIDLCLGAHLFYPAYSGPAVRFRRYAPGLRERGISVRVVTLVPEDNPSLSARIDSESDGPELEIPGGRITTGPEVDGLSVHWIRHQDGASPAGVFNRALAKIYENPETRPDLFQLLNAGPSTIPSLYKIDVPIVYTRTMMYEPPSSWWKRLLLPVYWRQPYRFLDCTVVSSSVMKENLREFGVDGRIEVIPNGTDVEKFRPAGKEEKRDIRRQLSLGVEDIVILFVGSMSPRKGIGLLLEAWERIEARFDQVHLLLVGPKRTEIRPDERASDEIRRLEEQLDRITGRTSVTHTGAVEDVAPYYRAADIFAFSSRKEGMPNVIPEAYACGLPVVMTPFTGLPREFGCPDEHYLLVERTAESLCEGLSKLVTSPARREEVGRKARELAVRRHALERSLDKYADLYRELAHGHRSRT